MTRPPCGGCADPVPPDELVVMFVGPVGPAWAPDEHVIGWGCHPTWHRGCAEAHARYAQYTAAPKGTRYNP